jgi:hypothetical protein
MPSFSNVQYGRAVFHGDDEWEWNRINVTQAIG